MSGFDLDSSPIRTHASILNPPTTSDNLSAGSLQSIDYLNSKARLAEKIFGWDRKTVALGLNELRSGIVCIDDFKSRGNKKTEEKMPQLEIDMVSLAVPESQIDPKSQTTFKYTRIR